MSCVNDNFYAELTGFIDFQEFSDLNRYSPLPLGWLVVIADIVDSTQAIHEGRYKDINALGVAAIVAVLNAVKPLNIPFVFGGDGATFCIPRSQQQAVTSALLATRHMAASQFGLAMRVGIVAMDVIMAGGHTVRIGKYQPYPAYQQAMFAGNGLGYAETLVKDSNPANPFLVAGSGSQAEGDFSGFECRWSEIPSPHEEIITLLVQCLDADVTKQQATYQSIAKYIIGVYGNESQHHPLRQPQLSLGFSRSTLAAETTIRTVGQACWQHWLYTLKLPLLVLFGHLSMCLGLKTPHGNWGLYKQRLIANTDYRKFDDVLRMVISGTASQRTRLRELLAPLHRDGKIVFGIHAAPTALITCMISDYDNRHVHFLDGSNGGYALAACEMKQQRRDLKGKRSEAGGF